MKNKLYKHKGLYIADSKVHGRGVFTETNISKGELIEECHYIDTGIPDIIGNTKLSKYIFRIHKDRGEVIVIPMGFLCSYNSSNKYCNVHWKYDAEKDAFIVRAYRDISEGEELFGAYNID